MAAFQCPLCTKISPSAKGAGNHFTRIHGVKSEQLAHHFHTPTVCECGAGGKFLSLTRGFSDHCPNCETAARSKGARLMHVRLKADTIKYNQFCSRISAAMLVEWSKDQSTRIEKMMTFQGGDEVHSENVDAYLEQKKLAVPWSLDQLSKIFEVA